MANHFQISKHFNKFATLYSDYAKFPHAMAEELVVRLKPIKIKPKNILLLGCADGYVINKLTNLYPNAIIYCLDLSQHMLKLTKEQLNPNHCFMLSKLDCLSVATNSIDLVISNLTMALTNEIQPCLQEIARVLQKDGLFVFSVPSIASFNEWQHLWRIYIDSSIGNYFFDLASWGDLLLEVGFDDPVVDVEQYQLCYPSIKAMHLEGKVLGLGLLTNNRIKIKKSNYKQFIEHYQQLALADGALPISCDMVFGQAWGVKRQQNAENEFFISVNEIGKV